MYVTSPKQSTLEMYCRLILLFILFIEFDFENPENVAKSKEIEKLLEDYESVSVEEWQHLAKSKGGLLSGNQ